MSYHIVFSYHIISYYIILHYITSCYVMLCYVMSCHVIPYYTILNNVIWYYIYLAFQIWIKSGLLYFLITNSKITIFGSQDHHFGVQKPLDFLRKNTCFRGVDLGSILEKLNPQKCASRLRWGHDFRNLS